MTIRNSVKLANVARYADDLMELLVDIGPLPARDICTKLGWPRSRFEAALAYARERRCPELGVSIPAPTPDMGWLYQVTTDWQPVEVGASYTLGLIESRLRATERDVRIILPSLTPRSKEWRRANFLSKHLSHLLTTLSEINDG